VIIYRFRLKNYLSTSRRDRHTRTVRSRGRLKFDLRRLSAPEMLSLTPILSIQRRNVSRRKGVTALSEVRRHLPVKARSRHSGADTIIGCATLRLARTKALSFARARARARDPLALLFLASSGRHGQIVSRKETKSQHEVFDDALIQIQSPK